MAPPSRAADPDATWAPDTQSRAEAIDRFRLTGGLPPSGVTLLGRWTRAAASTCPRWMTSRS
ncbi:DUF3303 domain-containing protein [Burkholderia sp. F1]|uniref:DUF3303 domain-containing protein n=1 Tax=Burkholderia sp. F1 TaxID=3366817 RepID=UPI003D717CE5